MKLDTDGHFFSSVDPSLCVNCGLCEKICPLLAPALQSPRKAYLCFAKNKKSRKAGSSGGTFGLIAAYLLLRGWFVCGASWDGLKVKHILIHELKDLPLIEKSKYVQSDLGNSFEIIRSLLQSNQSVCFSGTPCQCAALKKFLGEKDDPHLLVIDFLCHGVPPQSLFDRFLEREEKKKKIRILSFSFRAKTKANPHSFLYTFHKKESQRIKTKKGNFFEFPYYQAFLSYSIFIPACYRCIFSQRNRAGDITLGDGWESETINKKFQTRGKNQGVSEILVNTERGGGVFDKIKPQIEALEISSNFISKTNMSFRERNPLSTEAEKHNQISANLFRDFDATVSNNFEMKRTQLFKAEIMEKIPRRLYRFLHYVHHLPKRKKQT
jgi:coenzyme F420-reducing hydrogenase beta subunit